MNETKEDVGHGKQVFFLNQGYVKSQLIFFNLEKKQQKDEENKRE